MPAPVPRCPFPAHPAHVSIAAWQRGMGNWRHTLALLHQLDPNKCVCPQTSEWEGSGCRSAEVWEGSDIPVTQLPVLLCVLLSSLLSNSLRKENIILLFSIINPAVLCLEMVMRTSTCSKLQGLRFYFEFGVGMGPLHFSYCCVWRVYISYEAGSHQITKTCLFPSDSF